MDTLIKKNESLVEKAHLFIEADPDIGLALERYANELGVSVDHIIIGALRMVADDYNKATGNGLIPALM